MTTTATSVITTTTTAIIDAFNKEEPGESTKVWATFIIYRTLELIFGRVPYTIYRLLSYTVTATITLDFWGLTGIATIAVFGSFLYYRFRVDAKYTELGPTAEVPRNAFDLKPDNILDDQPSQPYADEFLNAFLSSIKVFGYLDKPVLKELVHCLGTKKLMPGEVLYETDSVDRDFYIVVDGEVEIFIKTLDGDEDDDGSLHLLNKVKSTGNVTSLFSILSILSEDLDLPQPIMSIESPAVNSTANSPRKGDQTPDGKNLAFFPEKNQGEYLSGDDNESVVSNTNTERSDVTTKFSQIEKDTSSDISKHSDIHPDDNSESTSKTVKKSVTSTSKEDKKKKKKIKKKEVRSVHPNLMARASKYTTLAVIPATSFRRLSEKYPKAAAHMVQVILTRFQRVTFLTLHRYLGLSRELLAIEQKVNELSGGDGLPPQLFSSDMVQRALWRVSHRYASSPPPYESTENTRHREESYFDRNSDTNSFETGGDDDNLKDAVFACISQLIGMTVSRANNSEATEDETKSVGSSTVERLYYSTRRTSVGSVSTSGAIRNLLDQDTVSVSSFSSGAMSEEFDCPEIEIQFFKRGEIILNEGDRSDGLYFVLDGVIEASTISNQMFEKRGESNKSNKQSLYLIQPGGIASYLAAMTGNASFVTLRAKSDLLVGLMPKTILDKYIDKYPNTLMCLAKRLVQELSPLVFHIDVALEWGQINAGQTLCRQGEDANSIYIVLTGRLRAIREQTNVVGKSDGKSFEIEGEYGPSESVGEMEVLIEASRPSTIHAIRDSEVAVMPKTLFNALALQHPEILLTISKMIALRSRQNQPSFQGGSRSDNENLKTVALLPVATEVPIVEFADKLREALVSMNVTAKCLKTSNVTSQLGKHAFTRLGRLKLLSWLAEQEETHRLVLYVADGGVNSPWTQRCIRQVNIFNKADCIIVIGVADSDPSIGEYEQLLLSMKTTARKELVLLHPDRSCAPGSTSEWLKSRLWIHAHHHIQLSTPGNANLLSALTKQRTIGNLGDHFQRFYAEKIMMSVTPSSHSTSPQIYGGARSDFSRLARRLLSKTVGLVLGGGGAKGIAHAGIIRAFEEVGIPIDMVGGTSMGAFVGGIYARDNSQVSVFGRVKMFCKRITSTWRMFLDLTYPVTSMTTGHEFNMSIWKAFFDTRIEDCWIPYFTVSANVTFSRLEIHQQGYMWRYIRSSMSLSGFVPPLCDNGSLLMDGGYLNNVPADIMRNLGAKVIVAVDVGGLDDTSPSKYGDSLSGWWVLFRKLNPFRKDYGMIPTLSDIQSRLAYASSVPLREYIAKMENVHYLVPPIHTYKTMDFQKFAEIEQIGYDYGKKVIQKWNEEGVLLEDFGVKLKTASTSHNRRASI